MLYMCKNVWGHIPSSCCIMCEKNIKNNQCACELSISNVKQVTHSSAIYAHPRDPATLIEVL